MWKILTTLTIVDVVLFVGIATAPAHTRAVGLDAPSPVVVELAAEVAVTDVIVETNINAAR
ncbi:hypothetical protein [Teredinibacter waterburyi]|uniref:hypothetical protein n=1 Tax=Teredinibacter waterburyi TaxID=1500538 RepID=UPI00165F2C63|nr:hypothetical protein [Teredinibacter waterburyi]